MISLIPGTQSDETFPYQPLVEDDGIRLVLLQPPSADKSDELRCTLYHTTLSRCDDDIIDHYTALSYVWGCKECPNYLDRQFASYYHGKPSLGTSRLTGPREDFEIVDRCDIN